MNDDKPYFDYKLRARTLDRAERLPPGVYDGSEQIATREPEVQRELEALKRAVQHLIKVNESMLERLAPVLPSDVLKATQSERLQHQRPPPPATALGSQVRSLSVDVETMAERMGVAYELIGL